MKKMSLLTALIAAVAISAYSVSGTYAKYTSKIDFTDDARVAKWSFTTDSTADENGMHKLDLFASSYKFDGKSKVWVKSVDDKNVVAPGTKGQASFNLTGNMETAFTIDYLMEAENDFVVYYKVADGKVTEMKTAAEMPTKTNDEGKVVVDATGYNEYRPLKYTITHTRNGKPVDAINSVLEGKTAAELAAAFKTYNDNNATMSDDHIFTPGTYTLSFDIVWEWKTLNTVPGDDADHTIVNTLDTFAGENLNTTKVNFNISAVANQVADDYSARNN